MNIEQQIIHFDKWFRHAEQIGQQRLYNFLMAASILLIGCASFMELKTLSGNILAGVLAALGLFLSRMWYILGTRQAKFHNKLNQELRDRFKELRSHEEYGQPEEFAIFHIQQMKDFPENQRELDEMNQPLRLTSVEGSLGSSRRFLWAVPQLFGWVFLVAFVIAGFLSFGWVFLVIVVIGCGPVARRLFVFCL